MSGLPCTSVTIVSARSPTGTQSMWSIWKLANTQVPWFSPCREVMRKVPPACSAASFKSSNEMFR